MRLPSIISKATLRGLEKPDETHVVRVIAHEANNSTVYRFRCRSREYRFERDGSVGKHILDIPVSVWMDGAPIGTRFRDNKSIAEDFRTAERSPYSMHVLPISVGAQSESLKSSADHLPVLRRLLSTLGAPDEVREAFAMIDAGCTTDELEACVSAMLENSSPQSADEETPRQRQARKMREAKANKKSSPQLQPA